MTTPFRVGTCIDRVLPWSMGEGLFVMLGLYSDIYFSRLCGVVGCFSMQQVDLWVAQGAAMLKST